MLVLRHLRPSHGFLPRFLRPQKLVLTRHISQPPPFPHNTSGSAPPPFGTPILPKPFYITTPIFYPNASPHIGHLYTLVIGDVFARYHRLKRGGSADSGNVHFLTGTDEHGMKIQKAAQKHFKGEKGREKEFCDELSRRFVDLGEKAAISNTAFMRTTGDEHRGTVEHVWRTLRDKGWIYKSKYSGWYSITDECFYTTDQVKDGHALETGSAVEWTEEENYMFRLSHFSRALSMIYEQNPGQIYPAQYRDDVLKMLDDVEDMSISRPRSRLSWGVQVPEDPSQTVYVWFDALLIYLTGAGYPASSPHDVWPADLQVIGKDILRFHAIYLPAILMALSSNLLPGESIPAIPMPDVNARTMRLADKILTHAHWTSSHKKMSKSVGNVVDPLKVMDEYGVDTVRYYLMRVGGKWREDADWSTAQLRKHQKEIQSQLGNYFLRVASPALFQRIVPLLSDTPPSTTTTTNQSESPYPSLNNLNSDPALARAIYSVLSNPDGRLLSANDPNAILLRVARELPERFMTCMEGCEVGMAVGEAVDVLKLANKTITDIAPWDPATPPEAVYVTRAVGLFVVRTVALCLEPVMPGVAEKVREVFGLQSSPPIDVSEIPDGGSIDVSSLHGFGNPPPGSRVFDQRLVGDSEQVDLNVGFGGIPGLELAKSEAMKIMSKDDKEEGEEKFWMAWHAREVGAVRLF